MIRIVNHRSIPVDTYAVAQLLARWTVPDGSDGQEMFNDLELLTAGES
jgi:hypothetical protein